MSLRTYTGPAPAEQAAPVAVAVGWFLAVATIALQIAFPLVDEDQRASLAAFTVVVFFLASVAHASAYHRWRGFLLVALVVPAHRVGRRADRLHDRGARSVSTSTPTHSGRCSAASPSSSRLPGR